MHASGRTKLDRLRAALWEFDVHRAEVFFPVHRGDGGQALHDACEHADDLQRAAAGRSTSLRAVHLLGATAPADRRA